MQKRNLLSHIEHIFLILVILCILPILLTFFHRTTAQDSSIVTKVSDGWYYLEDNKQVPVLLPAVIKSDKDTLTLYHDGSGLEGSDISLETAAALYQVTISLNGEPVYTYHDGNFQRNDQMKSKILCVSSLGSIRASDRLSLTYTKDAQSEFQLPEVYIGTGSNILLHLMKRQFFTLCIIMIMFLLGLFSAIQYLFSKHRGMSEKRLLYLASFLLLCGSWALTDSSFVQFFTEYNEGILHFSFCCFMLFTIPMVYFLKETAEMNKYPAIDVLKIVLYANIILQLLLNFCFGIPMVDMLLITHLLIFAGTILLIYLLIKENRNRTTPSTKYYLCAFLILAFFGIASLILYWTLRFTYYQEVFECGILFFILMLLYEVVNDQLATLRTKAEAEVYQRLSREDGMTGLLNRRAFDEEMHTISMRKDVSSDLLLIFFDLNNLKKINDNHGHSSGDETIIATAKCLESVFRSFGTCYRIGGDEFCVIIPSPENLDFDWNERLNRCLATYNESHPIPISIASGYSHLLDSNGSQKTVSDWKYEADKNMYTVKFQMKEARRRV